MWQFCSLHQKILCVKIMGRWNFCKYQMRRNLNEKKMADFLEDTINVAVGMPHMLSGGLTEWITASNQISAKTSSFSSDGIIYVGDNGVTIPKNAYATKVYYSGSKPSSISYWRVKEPLASTWRQSRNYWTSIDIDYEKDSNVRRHIVVGANRILFSVYPPTRLCRIGTYRRL